MNPSDPLWWGKSAFCRPCRFPVFRARLAGKEVELVSTLHFAREWPQDPLHPPAFDGATAGVGMVMLNCRKLLGCHIQFVQFVTSIGICFFHGTPIIQSDPLSCHPTAFSGSQCYPAVVGPRLARIHCGIPAAWIQMDPNSKPGQFQEVFNAWNIAPYHTISNSTLWWTNNSQWKMAIEIVSFPMKNGDFPLLC